MRTFNEIVEAIRSDFINNITLQEMYELDTSKTFDEQFSTVSLESILSYIIASAIYLHEQIVHAKVDVIEATIASEYPFTKDWYKRKFLLFQLGDSLSFDEDTQKFSYPALDESKQIIKYVAIREAYVEGVSCLQLYVSKDNKEILSVSELAAFEAYVKSIAALGTHFLFISQVPDKLTLTSTVTYDPQILSNTGMMLTSGEDAVSNAVTDYLDNIKYSGRFNRTKCVDAMQRATGVLDVVLDTVLLNDIVSNTQSFASDSGFYELVDINVIYIPGNEDDY